MRNIIKGSLFLLLTVISCKKPETPSKPEPVVPALAQATPGQIEVGDVLTLTGVNLSNVNKVYFNTVSVNPESKSAIEVRVIVPVLPEGSYAVSVENSAGRSNSMNVAVKVPLPAVIEGNNFVVLSGYDFTFTGRNMQGVTGVNFHGNIVKPKSVSETSVVVAVPETAHKDKTWWKIHLEGKGGNSNAVDLELIPGPKVTKRIPNEPYPGMPLIIQGKNLKWAFSVGFSGEWVEKEDFRKYTDEEIIIDVPKTLSAGKKKFALHAANGKDVQEEEINVASLQNGAGVNPGNISVNPGGIGSVGSFSMGCTGYMHFIYIHGILFEMSAGTCTFFSNKEIDGKTYYTWRPYSSSYPNIELGYEYIAGKGYTGSVYLAEFDSDNQLNMTHYGKLLEKEAFNTDKFVTVALMISREDGQIHRVCTPRIHDSWGFSNVGTMNASGDFYYWSGITGLNSRIDAKCNECSECK